MNDTQQRNAGAYVKPEIFFDDKVFTYERVKYFTIYHLMISGAIANVAVLLAVCTGHLPAVHVTSNVNLMANAEAQENVTPTPTPIPTVSATPKPTIGKLNVSELQRMYRDNGGELPLVAPDNKYAEYTDEWYEYNAQWHDKAASALKHARS
jgi:hypothetical protein